MAFHLIYQVSHLNPEHNLGILANQIAKGGGEGLLSSAVLGLQR